MRFARNNTFLLLFLPFFFSCASIVSKSSWPFTVDSEPSGAMVSIANKAGREVYRGKAPATMRLKSGAGFFSKESYTITLSMSGFETKKVTVDCKLNGWYFGNILFGGLIGFLIVDPATGAMYKLDAEEITETLTRTTASTAIPSLKILDKTKLSADMQGHLVKLN